MDRDFKWYTPKTRTMCHITFYFLVTTLYFLYYRRLGDSMYIWLFIGKDLFIGSLFYSASFLLFKWISKDKIYPIFIFVILTYVGWITWSYFTCYFARSYVPESDKELYLYLGFFLDNGFFDLFTFDKFSVLVLEFTFILSVPFVPILIKTISENSLKMIKLERDNLILEKTVWMNSMEMMKLEQENVSLESNFLKSQISPHFLFNTLNSIYRMSETNDPQTSEIVLRLSNLVRYILYQGKNEEILLAKEVEFIKDYISLGKLRFGEKNLIKSNIADIDEPYKIVPLILISFVENAFKHGPDRSRIDAWIDIFLTIVDEKLILTIKNGVNHSVEKSIFGGLGLENVRRRLELHYPRRHQLIIDEDEGSFSVDLAIDLI